MKKKLIIDFWILGPNKKKIPEIHESDISDSCLKRISECLQNGFTSGELCETYNNKHGKEVECRGWFEVEWEY